jgi:xanthine/uracil permease
MGGGALLWCWRVWLRAVDPPMWTAREIPLWLFGGYSLLTIAGLALIGTALRRSRIDAWVGRLAIGAAALFLVLGILFGDMPPFVYYLVTLTIGLKLLRSSTDGN